MTRRPNRIVLLLVAALVLAGAAVPLLAAAGQLELLAPADLYEQARASAAAYPLEWLAGIAAAGIVLAALGAWLVRRQLRVRPGGRLGTLAVERGERGRTTLEAAAVANAAAADLRRIRGVENSNVRLVTFGARPRIIVDLDIDRDASLREVLDNTESVYERLCHHLGVDDVHVDTRARPSTRRAGRVA